MTFQPGIRFGLVRVLRIGIVLLGIRLSLGEAGAIGLQALPVIIGAVARPRCSSSPTWRARSGSAASSAR